jgi:toxin ParE1/3/4
MAALRLSARARSDLVGIGEYTLRTWGEPQATRYLKKIEDCMERLAESPMLGRPCNEIVPGLRRIEEGRHVIFYRPMGDRVVVSRILHRSMLAQGTLQ